MTDWVEWMRGEKGYLKTILKILKISSKTPANIKSRKRQKVYVFDFWH